MFAAYSICIIASLIIGFRVGLSSGLSINNNDNSFNLYERYRGINTSLIQLRKRAEAEEELVKARQKNLQLQMNPHFIFNALTGIHMLLLRGDTRPALKSLDQFKGLLIRSWGSATDNPRTLRPSIISNEIKFLKDYIALESLRLSGKINFTINSFINPKHSIPAFLIQPLVENAIWHGLDYSEKGIPEIILTFRTDIERGFLVITVEDNGGGLSTSNSISQPSHKSAAKRQSHGLRIIKERLKLISPKASLHLDNRKEERGCIATISIPS
jgi:sensor histidine kinase YesM